MLKNYLIVAFRNLVRQRGYAAINIAGLAIGVAFALLAFFYLHHEWSYDRFHVKADQIHLIRYEYRDSANDDLMVATPPVLAPTLVEQVPGFEHAVRVYWGELGDGVPISSAEGMSLTARGMYADPEFFRIFSFKAVAGDPGTALENLDGLVLSADLARRCFGGIDPVGQSLTVFSRGQERPYTVRGVVEVPDNSSLTFDFAISHRVRGEFAGSGWGMCHVLTFVELPTSLELRKAEERLAGFVERNIPQETRASFAGGGIQTLRLMPLTEMHFAQDLREIPKVLDPLYCWAVGIIGFSVLALACINFINLSLGLLSRRVREVGIRKSLGATHRQLTGQFLAESILVALFSVVLGLSIAELALPGFAALMGSPLTPPMLPSLAAAAVLAVGIGLATGGYPALVLSRLDLVEILRGRGSFGGTRYVSRGLVILQFACSIGFAIAISVMARQVEYLRSRDLGFDAEQLLKLDLVKAQPRGPEEYNSFVTALRQVRDQGGGIVALAGANNGLISDDLEGTVIELDGREMHLRVFEVEAPFLETLGLRLLAGRSFDDLHGSNVRDAMLVNESLARVLGSGPVVGGRPSVLPSGDSRFQGTTVGVVSDFQMRPLRQRIEPAVFRLAPDPWLRYLYVRLSPGDLRSSLARVERAWQTAFPGRPFAYSFVDDDVENALRQDGRWIPVVRYAAGIALFIANLGVLGLTALTIARRTKEIGIRKVLGASIPSIVALLSKEFTYLVLVANLISWPVAYYAMNQWLQSFAYRIELGPGVFVLGGVLALLIAWLTVSYQAIRAARANPVEALRYE